MSNGKIAAKWHETREKFNWIYCDQVGWTNKKDYSRAINRDILAHRFAMKHSVHFKCCLHSKYAASLFLIARDECDQTKIALHFNIGNGRFCAHSPHRDGVYCTAIRFVSISGWSWEIHISTWFDRMFAKPASLLSWICIPTANVICGQHTTYTADVWISSLHSPFLNINGWDELRTKLIL